MEEDAYRSMYTYTCSYIRTSLNLSPAPSTLIKPYSLIQVIEALTFQQPPNGVQKHQDSGVQEEGGRKRAVEGEKEEEGEDRSSTNSIPIANKEDVCISISPAAVALKLHEQDSSGPLNTNSRRHNESIVSAAAFPVEFGR